MELRNKTALTVGMGFIFLMVLTQNAHAYLDPGTGSFFIQMILAGLLGGLFLVKGFWRNFLNFFKNLFLKIISITKKTK